MTRKATAKLVPASSPSTQTVAVSEAAAIFSMIQRLATDPAASFERVEQAWTFYQRVQADNARKAFAVALIAAQAEMEPVRKDATNTQTKSKYATFEALDRSIRPIYTRHKFGITHRVEESPKPDHIRVVTTLMHEAGYERDYPFDIPADGKGAKGGDVMTKTHAAGSAFSYGKRYNLGGAFNIATFGKDDDGNKAAGLGDDGALLSAEQIKELDDLITETKSDKALFLQIGGVEALADIRASQFANAKGLLLKKKKDNA